MMESQAKNILVRGSAIVNSSAFNFTGAGVIRCNGVYDAILNFSALPAGFHPSAVGSFIISNCCGVGASARNGAKNMASMGATEYAVQRYLTIGRDDIKMIGNAILGNESIELEVTIEGKMQLPDDLVGHSIYFKKITPYDRGSKIHRLTISYERKRGFGWRRDLLRY